MRDLDRDLLQLCLLELRLRERGLPALCAFIAVEVLGLVGVDPDDYQGSPHSSLCEVADVADYRLPSATASPRSARHCSPADSRCVAAC